MLKDSAHLGDSMILVYILCLQCIVPLFKACSYPTFEVVTRILVPPPDSSKSNQLEECKFIYPNRNFQPPTVTVPIDKNVDADLMKVDVIGWIRSGSKKLCCPFSIVFDADLAISMKYESSTDGSCEVAVASISLNTLNIIRQEEDFYFNIYFLARDADNHSKDSILGELAVCVDGRNPTLLTVLLYLSEWTMYRGQLGTAGKPFELYIPEKRKGLDSRVLAILLAHDSVRNASGWKATYFNVTWSITSLECNWLTVEQDIVDKRKMIFLYTNKAALNFEELSTSACSVRFTLVRVCKDTECGNKTEFTVRIVVLDADDPLDVKAEVKNSTCNLRVTDEDAANSPFNTLHRVCFELAPNGVYCAACSQQPDLLLYANGPSATIELVSDQFDWCQASLCIVRVTVLVVDDQSKIAVVCMMKYDKDERLSSSRSNSSKTLIRHVKSFQNSTCPAKRGSISQATIWPNPASSWADLPSIQGIR